MRMMERWSIVLMVSVAVKQVIFIALIPAWQVPDEPAHVAYVQSIIEQKRFPVFSSQRMDVSREMLWSMTAIEDTNPNRLGRLYPPGFLSTPHGSERRLTDDSPPRNLAARNSPIYYLYTGLAYLAADNQPIEVRLQAMRLASSLLLLVTVWLAIRIAKDLQFSDATSVVFGVIVGWHPAMTAIFAGVNPDTALILVATWCFYLLLGPPTSSIKKRIFLIAVAVGLATSIKPEAWFLAIPAGAWLIWHYRSLIQARAMKSLIVSAVVMAILAGGWLSIQSWRSPTSVLIAAPTPAAGLSWPAILNNDLFERPAITFRTFWGYLGWSGVSGYSPEWTFGLVLIVTMVASLGSVVWLIRNKKKKSSMQPISIFLVAAITLEAFYQYLYWRAGRLEGATNFPVHGRYYLPLIVPLVIWLVAGLQSILPRKWRWFASAVVAGSAVTATVVLATLAWHLYRFERLAGF